MCRSVKDGDIRCQRKHPAPRRAAGLAKRRATYAAGRADRVTRDPMFSNHAVGDAVVILEDGPDMWASPAVDNAGVAYAQLIAGKHEVTDPIGARVGAATLKWETGRFAVKDAEAYGLTLRDYGKTEESYQTIFGFADQAGGEWITVHDGDARYRDPDENPRRTDPKAWEVVEIVEVTGDYERKLGELAGDWRSSFHRGPASVTSDAMDAVKVGLGDRWTPTYVTYGQNRLLRPEEVTDGHDSEDVLTLHAASGDVLASVHLPHETSMEDDQVDVGFKLAREAGWLSVLNADEADATTGPSLTRIPVSVKDATDYANWIGENNHTTIPVQEWLSACGLKAEAATAAIGRQLLGPPVA